MTELFLFDAHTVLFPQPSEFRLSIPAKHLRCEWTDFWFLVRFSCSDLITLSTIKIFLQFPNKSI